MLKYSIVLTTFNRATLTAGVVYNLLFLLKDRDDFEIVIVNDGSIDNTIQVMSQILRFYPCVRLINTDKVNGQSRNHCFARNIGIKAALAEIVCLCDGDIFHLIDPLKFMDKIVSDNGIDNFYATGVFMRTDMKGRCTGPYGKDRNMPHGSWLATSKRNFEKIGGYDERFKIYGNEDHDIVQRLERLGLKHVSESNIIAFHPAFDPGRNANHEADFLKAKQMEFQRESSVVRNLGKDWGKGGKEFFVDDTENSLQVVSSSQIDDLREDIQVPELRDAIDNINNILSMLVEDSVKIGKIFNLTANLNSVLVSHQDTIFRGKKHVPFLGGMREVFGFVGNLNKTVCSDFSEVVGGYSDVFELNEQMDLIVLGQIHRQRNVGLYLDAAFDHLKVGGELVVICPLFSNCIGSGNTNNLWNAGALLYNLIMSGFDCKRAKVATFVNQIQIYLQKSDRPIPVNRSLATLFDFFPVDTYQHFNGNILEVNWNK